MRIIIRLLVNAAALWVADYLVDGLELTDDIIGLLVVAAVFGLVNAFIKPIVKLLSLPVRIITLGLFALVINAAMLGITAWITNAVDGDYLDIPGGFWSAILAALIISIVSAVLGSVVPDPE
jgi:putative membrane protein